MAFANSDNDATTTTNTNTNTNTNENNEQVIHFGVFADCHYVDRDPKINRYYRESLEKLQDALDEFQSSNDYLKFVVNLGDLIDIADGSVEKEILSVRNIQKILAPIQNRIPIHHVWGNHCLEILTKKELAQELGKDCPDTAYSFTIGDAWHFIVMDACFTKDGQSYSRHNPFLWTDTWIPAPQLDWLRRDLVAHKRLPTIVFTHQRLDSKDENYSVRNAAEVRNIFRETGNVKAVFQGHWHKNDEAIIDGIPYCVIRAVCEGPGRQQNSGFAKITLRKRRDHDSIRVSVTGFVQQNSYEWKVSSTTATSQNITR